MSNVLNQIAKLPAAKRAQAVKSAIELGLLTREQADKMHRAIRTVQAITVARQCLAARTALHKAA